MSSKTLNFISVKTWVMAISFVFILALGANASGIDMTGKWTMQVKSETSSGSPVFDIQQEGEKLTGTYNGKFGEAPITGTVNGDEFKLTYEMSGVSVTYAGKTDGNTCQGDVDYGMYGKATFTGKK